MTAVENVWDYPRPPALEPVAKPVRIVFAGRTIAATHASFRVLETSHPPVFYLPPDCFTGCTLEPASGSSFCEWKGRASFTMQFHHYDPVPRNIADEIMTKSA